MSMGCWREVLRVAEQCLAAPPPPPPHFALQLHLCRMLSHSQLRMFKAAVDECAALGDLDDVRYSYEAHSGVYPAGLKGSMVPFSMRILKAQLPYFLRSDLSLDPLYSLLAQCRQEVQRRSSTESASSPSSLLDSNSANSVSPLVGASGAPAHSQAPSADIIAADLLEPPKETLDVWLLRESRMMFIIATRLLQEKEYPLAILLLQELIQKHPEDSVLLSSLGRVYLQMGDIRSAAVTFKQADSVGTNPILSNMNRGYLALSLDQFTTAIAHFQAVLDLDPSNLIATNNKAVCLLYTCDLGRAVSCIEDLIIGNPEHALNEVLVFNLCTMYDLKSDNSQEKKKNLMLLISKYASDSFDYSVLKMDL